MHPSSHKPLALLLAMIVGLLPMQIAFAATGDALAAATSTGLAMDDCSQCESAFSCADIKCAAHFCAVAVLPSAALPVPYLSSVANLIEPFRHYVGLPANLLLRPPRA